jgi:hypothetical protein
VILTSTPGLLSNEFPKCMSETIKAWEDQCID